MTLVISEVKTVSAPRRLASYFVMLEKTLPEAPGLTCQLHLTLSSTVMGWVPGLCMLTDSPENYFCFYNDGYSLSKMIDGHFLKEKKKRALDMKFEEY